MKYYSIIMSLLFFVFLSCDKEREKEKEEMKKYGTLYGVILNEYGNPLEGALVELGNISRKSNAEGEFLFENLEVNEYTITISKEFYLTKIQKLTIREDKFTRLDVTLNAGEVLLDVSVAIKNLSASSGSFEVNVSSNVDWILIDNTSWLNCELTQGRGDMTVEINYLENTGDAARSDTLYFVSGQISRSLVVKQVLAIKLIEYKGILGNNERWIPDSVHLLFNKPVKVENIESNWDGCITEINYVQTNENRGISFVYSCAKLGGKYPFTIRVSDFWGNVFNERIEVPFYHSKLDFDAHITDFLMVNGDKEILVSLYKPNASKIVRYSIEKDSVIQTYDLSSTVSPLKLIYNPYNDKIYILGSKPDAILSNIEARPDGFENDSPDVFCLNMESSQVLHAFTIKPDDQDHPDFPNIIPYDLGFTKSGLGLIVLIANGSSTLRWKIIDSSKNDTLYNYPFYDNEVDEFTNFISVHENFDYSKLFLTQPYGLCNYGIFNEKTQKISMLTADSQTRAFQITPYRKSDRMFARQLYDQFIIDLNGNMSQITDYDSRYEGKADFCYLENKEDVIYICEARSSSYPYHPSTFYVYDYKNATTLMWCEVIEFLYKFSTTIDGKYAAAARINADFDSSLYIFDTNEIHRYIVD